MHCLNIMWQSSACVALFIDLGSDFSVAVTLLGSILTLVAMQAELSVLSLFSSITEISEMAIWRAHIAGTIVFCVANFWELLKWIPELDDVQWLEDLSQFTVGGWVIAYII
jgi:PAS domain-containing protein